MKRLRFELLMLLVFLTVTATAQITLQTVNFETASGYTVSGGQTTTSDDWWERAISSDVAPMDPFTGYQGSYFFYGEDTDNGRTADDPVYVTLNALNTTGYSNFQIRILVAGKNNAGAGLEQEEYLRIQYAWDGGEFSTLAQYIAANLNDEYYTEDANGDGTADGSTLSPSFSEFAYNIPGSGSSLQIRLMANVDQGNEEIGFDNIRILGTDASLPVDLSHLSARCGEQQVILEWRTESEVNNLGFILERRYENTDWSAVASYHTHDELKSRGNTSSGTEYMFIDSDVEPGETYIYRLSDISTDGTVTVYVSLSVIMDPLPGLTEMEKARPNPFNPQTFIGYCLKEDVTVDITVFDLLGRPVRTIFNGRQTAGNYHVYWNGTDAGGYKVPSSTYFIRMQTENITLTQRVMLMK